MPLKNIFYSLGRGGWKYDMVQRLCDLFCARLHHGCFFFCPYDRTMPELRTLGFSVPAISVNYDYQIKIKQKLWTLSFFSVFTREQMTFPEIEPSPFHSIGDLQFSPNGVTKQLAQLNPQKACGPDELYLQECLKRSRKQLLSGSPSSSHSHFILTSYHQLGPNLGLLQSLKRRINLIRRTTVQFLWLLSVAKLWNILFLAIWPNTFPVITSDWWTAWIQATVLLWNIADICHSQLSEVN